MTSNERSEVATPYTYDNFQKLCKEVAELRALTISLAAQLKSAEGKIPPTKKQDG